MKINQRQKRQLLASRIHYQDLVHWDAFAILSEAKDRLEKAHAEKMGIGQIDSEKKFDKWIRLKQGESISLHEAFKARLNPHFLLWLFLRKEIVPERILHQLALYFCRDFHERLVKEGVYINHRYSSLLAVKKQWAARKASLGQLNYAIRSANTMTSELQESDDRRMIAGAQAMQAALNTDGRIAVFGVFRVINQVYAQKRENVRRFATLRDALDA